MIHIAIMKKSWGLLEKIVSGEKVIESRWYLTKRIPWDRIKPDETVYFKNSGEPVSLKCKVEKVLQFADLTPTKIAGILKEYGTADGIFNEDLPKYYEQFKNKNFCMLIFLKEVKKVKPFNINKKGYGLQSAWLITKYLKKLKG